MANYSSTTYSFGDVDCTFMHPGVGVHQVNGEERLNLMIVDDAIPAGSKLY